jgi:hypothetical protein
MARVRLDFRTLLLLEDEEAGDTHMAMYTTVVDSGGNNVATFRWNNFGTKVNETNTYNLGIDPNNPNVIDFDLNTWATISVPLALCSADTAAGQVLHYPLGPGSSGCARQHIA